MLEQDERTHEAGVGDDCPAMGDLSGRRVLIVEDEYFLASDLAKALKSSQAEVVGPEPTPERARRHLGTENRIDAAILDINLRGVMVYELADDLLARGTPILFLSGYDDRTPPPRFADIAHLRKPSPADGVVKTLAGLLGSRATR